MSKWAAVIFGFLSLVFLVVIWSDNPSTELVWYLLPLGGLWRQIGGTWQKAIGRFLPPIAIAVSSIVFIGWSWWILPILGAYSLLKILPVTLIGDGLEDSPLNWIWIWVVGLLNGLACMTFAIPMQLAGVENAILTGAVLSLITMILYSGCITLSNIKTTRNWFVWKSCEFIMGMSVMIPVCTLIQVTQS